MNEFTMVLKDQQCLHNDEDIRPLALCHAQKKPEIKILTEVAERDFWFL